MLRLLLVVAFCAACGSTDFSGSNASKPAAKPKPTAPQQPAQTPQKPGTDDATPAPGNGSKPDPVSPPEDDSGANILVPEKPPAPNPLPSPPPPPPNAVVQGSFTVYTQPADPAPFQDYRIVIEVKLPSNVTAIDRNDLSGRVIGTDSYVQNIGSSADPFDAQEQQFSFQPGRAVLRVPVPGALDTVRDTIEVRSRVLNEGQTVTITF